VDPRRFSSSRSGDSFSLRALAIDSISGHQVGRITLAPAHARAHRSVQRRRVRERKRAFSVVLK
jgi:hypothetical protein